MDFKDKLLVAIYQNVDGLSAEKFSRVKYNMQQNLDEISDGSVYHYYIPVTNQDTKVEVINPVTVDPVQYEQIKMKLDRIAAILDKDSAVESETVDPYDILCGLIRLFGDNAVSVKRRMKKEGCTGGDTVISYAFDVEFVDYVKQNNRSVNGGLMDNMDFWMPLVRERFNVMESYFQSSNFATIWILKKQ